VEHALRDPADRARTVEVLRWSGADGVDVMLDAVCRSEVVGARRFLHDALGTMPEAYAAVAPLLASPAWHEVHHAAGIIGRMAHPDGLPRLRPLLAHPDPRVRSAAVHALAEYPPAAVADALHAALTHSTAGTRAAAADAIGGRRLAAFAMPIVAALEGERDGTAWRAMVGALAAIGTAESCAALAAAALARRTLAGGGYSSGQRLEAVHALAHADTRHAAGALERVARDAGGAVAKAAADALARFDAGAG
jgi:HEAT repeat protein